MVAVELLQFCMDSIREESTESLLPFLPDFQWNVPDLKPKPQSVAAIRGEFLDLLKLWRIVLTPEFE